jgi:hypothetical protein
MTEGKSIVASFSIVPDPRIDRQKKHKLLDVIIIAICGVTPGFRKDGQFYKI